MPTNLLQDGDIWLDDQMQQHAGRSVELVRRGKSTGSITAVAVEVEYDAPGDDGFTTQVTSRDYYLQASELVIDSATVEPREGDIIIETMNGTAHQFELMKMGSKPAAELLGDARRWKVHTKRVQ